MEQVKPIMSLYGSKGLALLRKSKHAIKVLLDKHRTKLIVAASIGIGAYAYVSRESPKIELTQEKKDQLVFCHIISILPNTNQGISRRRDQL